MQLIIQTIKDLTPLQTTTYVNKRGELALGYNHTLGVYNGQTCTLKEAETWLYTDINAIRQALRGLITTKLHQHQERALISLVHDIGLDTFIKSKLLENLNKGKFLLAASNFVTYNKNNRTVSVSVIRRRQIEQNIFNLRSTA